MKPVQGRRALMVGLLSGVVCVAFESVAVATAMPQAAQDLGGVGLYAWAFTLFVLGMVFSTALAGRLADRIGPVVPLAVGTSIFLAGLVLAGAAPSMPVLVAARFLQGVGGGAMNLCLMVVVAHAFDETERARIMTWFSFCWVMPAFIGPPISAAITRHLGWHWVFWLLVPLLLAAAALSARPLLQLKASHEPDAGQANPVPLWAAALAAVSVAGLQGAGQLMGGRGAALAAVSVVVLLMAVPRLMPTGFLRIGTGLSAVVWTRACQAGSFFAAESFLPLALVEGRGMSLFEAGLALTVGSLGWTLGSWMQSQPWLRLRRDRIIQLGVACSLLGLAAIALSARVPHGPLALAAVGWSIGGLGMGLAIASSSLAVMALSPPAQLGRNTSSLQTAEGLGNSMVGAIAGTIFHALHATAPAAHTFSLLFGAAAMVCLFGLACSLRIGAVPNASARVVAA